MCSVGSKTPYGGTQKKSRMVSGNSFLSVLVEKKINFLISIVTGGFLTQPQEPRDIRVRGDMLTLLLQKIQDDTLSHV